MPADEGYVDRRRPVCGVTDCPDTLTGAKVDLLIVKVDALSAVVSEIEGIKQGFSILWKIVAGAGAFGSACIFVYQFLKAHWKP